MKIAKPLFQNTAKWVRYEEERYKTAVHVPNFDTLVPTPELSLKDAKNNPFRNMTTHCIGSDSSRAGTRV